MTLLTIHKSIQMRIISKEENRIIIRKNGVVTYASRPITNEQALELAFKKANKYESGK